MCELLCLFNTLHPFPKLRNKQIHPFLQSFEQSLAVLNLCQLRWTFHSSLWMPTCLQPLLARRALMEGRHVFLMQALRLCSFCRDSDLRHPRQKERGHHLLGSEPCQLASPLWRCRFHRPQLGRTQMGGSCCSRCLRCYLQLRPSFQARLRIRHPFLHRVTELQIFSFRLHSSYFSRFMLSRYSWLHCLSQSLC